VCYLLMLRQSGGADRTHIAGQQPAAAARITFVAYVHCMYAGPAASTMHVAGQSAQAAMDII
jgi:hypothetical protein